MRERILRAQFDDGVFSDEDETTLATFNAEHPDGALERYKFLVGLWHV